MPNEFIEPMQWLVYGVLFMAALGNMVAAFRMPHSPITPEMRLHDAIGLSLTLCMIFGAKWSFEYAWTGVDNLVTLFCSFAFATLAAMEYLLKRILELPPPRRR